MDRCEKEAKFVISRESCSCSTSSLLVNRSSTIGEERSTIDEDRARARLTIPHIFVGETRSFANYW